LLRGRLRGTIAIMDNRPRLGHAMCFFGLLGMAGLYARQVKEAGWIGLAGYLLLSLFYALTAPYTFAEAVILPLWATTVPTFVEGFLGLQ
jgi:hypothetical protein